MKTAGIPQELPSNKGRLKDYFNYDGALCGQEEMINDLIINMRKTSPEDRMSWHLSVLLRTTLLFPEIMFQQMFNKFPKSPKVTALLTKKKLLYSHSQKTPIFEIV